MSNKKYDLSDVQQLLNEGYTVQDIMKIKGCKHHFTIYSYIKQNNIIYESRYSKDLTGYEWNNCGNTFRLNTYEIFKSNQKSCGCIFKSKAYKLSHPNRTGYQEISGNFWYELKQNAKVRNIEFDLKIEDLWELLEFQNMKCKLSGICIGFGLENGMNSRKDTTASLDRIDSKKGYTIDNVQWVHKRINMMKQSLSDDDFIFFCKAVANNVK
jgi:hypothetical protein